MSHNRTFVDTYLLRLQIRVPIRTGIREGNFNNPTERGAERERKNEDTVCKGSGVTYSSKLRKSNIARQTGSPHVMTS